MRKMRPIASGALKLLLCGQVINFIATINTLHNPQRPVNWPQVQPLLLLWRSSCCHFISGNMSHTGSGWRFTIPEPQFALMQCQPEHLARRQTTRQHCLESSCVTRASQEA